MTTYFSINVCFLNKEMQSEGQSFQKIILFCKNIELDLLMGFGSYIFCLFVSWPVLLTAWSCPPPFLSRFKGMVHMITRLTFISQLQIEEYKNPLNTLNAHPLPCFSSFFVP